MESTLSICSTIGIDYLLDELYDIHQSKAIKLLLSKGFSSSKSYLKSSLYNFRRFQITEITSSFKRLSDAGYTFEYDRKLAENLHELKFSRCSTIIHDIGYISAINPQRFTEPEELHGLENLLKAAKV